MRLRSVALPLLASMVVLAPGLRRATAQIVPPFPTGSFPPVSWPTLPPLGTTAPVPTTVVTSPKTGPYVRGLDYVLTAKTTAPKTTLLAAATPFPRFAPDGKTLLLAGATTRLGSLTTPLGVVLKGTRAHRSAWAPDSKNLVTSDEDGQLVVWAVPTGKEVRRIDDAFKQFGSVGSGKYTSYEVGFPDAKTVLFHTGCRLKKLDVSTTGATPVALGVADQCGRPQVSRDGKRWVLLEQGTKQYGVGLWYSRALSIDTSTGVHTAFLEESKVGPFSDVQLSPTGDRLCFVRVGRKVSCVTVADGKVDDVSDGPADRWLGFDNAGTHLLYGDSSGKDRALHHVDFAARTVRRVATIADGTNYWVAFAGDRRVIAYGYAGGTIYDLDKLWSQPVFPKVEVEGFAPVPGDPSRAILGKASGPSRDLYWLTVSD